jgi:hypothetical protein
MSLNLNSVVYKAEFLLIERSTLLESGPALQIIHRFRSGTIGCQDGEEVFSVLLAHRGRRFVISLPLSLRLVLDYLARHRRTPQSATQVASGMRASSFYRFHGQNSGLRSTRKISRTAVKEYVKRLRRALGAAFLDAGITLEPSIVLVSRGSHGKEVLYWLRAVVEWLHENDLSVERRATGVVVSSAGSLFRGSRKGRRQLNHE